METKVLNIKVEKRELEQYHIAAQLFGGASLSGWIRIIARREAAKLLRGAKIRPVWMTAPVPEREPIPECPNNQHNCYCHKKVGNIEVLICGRCSRFFKYIGFDRVPCTEEGEPRDAEI